MDTQLKTQQSRYWRAIQRVLAVAASIAIAGFAVACDDGAETDEGVEGASEATTSAEEDPCDEEANPEENEECADDPTEPPSIDPSQGITDDDKAAGMQTISGTIEEGVEHGCLIMTTDDGTVYGLYGGEDDVMQVGNDVTLEGEVDETVMSFCQQGTPFVVTQATLND